mmetsp:Transcript_30868/g.76780  ORF Transcript_30868/g.76780 Transcript_30868/m.76780 type:complete len:238 (-) Transcript_30868:398-1111(-)
MMMSFFITFMAYMWPLSLLRTWNTFPNAPWPTRQSISKSSGVSFFCAGMGLSPPAPPPPTSTVVTLFRSPESMRRRLEDSRDLVSAEVGVDAVSGYAAVSAPGEAAGEEAPPEEASAPPANPAPLAPLSAPAAEPMLSGNDTAKPMLPHTLSIVGGGGVDAATAAKPLSVLGIVDESWDPTRGMVDESTEPTLGAWATRSASSRARARLAASAFASAHGPTMLVRACACDVLLRPPW